MEEVEALKWYLLGFLSSAEGWNSEYPFDLLEMKDPKNMFEKLFEYLFKKDEATINLIRDFKKLWMSNIDVGNLPLFILVLYECIEGDESHGDI